MKDRLKRLLVFLACLIGLGIFSFLLSSYLDARRGRVLTAEHVPTAQDLPSWLQLPQAARNISYCKIQFFFAYEFDISREEFLVWAQSKEYTVQNCDGPTQILRYNAYLVPLPQENTLQAMQAYESSRHADVTNGYEYYRLQKNGSSVHLVYNLDTGRAYYVEK